MATRRIIVSGALVIGALLSPSFAQSAIDNIVDIDEFIVRAPRLPESAATLSRVELSAMPVASTTIENFSERAANFHLASNGARSFTDTYSFRGLTNTPIFGDPAVTFYLDDLPLGSAFTFPTDLTGFATGELHRGPGQNSRFGRAGSAGVIGFTTPVATPEQHGRVRVGFGDYGQQSAAVEGFARQGTGLDAYVALSYQARDGYVTNTRLGIDIDPQESLAALARFRVQATDRLELALLITAQRARDGVQPLVPLFGPLYTVDRSAEGETNVDSLNAALRGTVHLDSADLSLISSYTDWELGPYSNVLDFGFAELGNGSELSQQNFNQELKLTSSPDAANPWLLGAFYSEGTTAGGFVRAFGGFPFEQSSYTIAQRNLATYGEYNFAVNDRLTLTPGLRLERTTKDFTRDEIIPAQNRITAVHRSEVALPKLAAGYQLDADSSLFASIGRGYKAGGFSGFTGNASLAPFDQETSTAFEIGATRDWRTSTPLTLTVRAFWYEIKGYQIERSFATGATTDDYLVINAPKARSLGSELELRWEPLAGMHLSADLGWNQVELRDFTDPYSGDVFDGRAAPYVPEYDISLRADYMTEAGWFVGAELNRTGETYYTEGEDPTFGQKPYSLVSAHLGYARGPFRVTAFGQNLTAEEYYSAITPGTFHGTPGHPRTWGAETSWSF